MIIRAEKPNTHYTVLRNSVVRDTNLSYKARGILAAILSRPDNWRTSSEALAAEGAEGRFAVLSGLKELEEAGYLVRKKIRDKTTGQIQTISTVFDEPTGVQFPDVGSPDVGEPRPYRSNVEEVTGVAKATPSGVLAETVQPKKAANKYTEDFEAFWKSYPRNAGSKAKCAQYYATAVKKVPVDQILEAVVAQTAAWKKNGTETQFIPWPQTWLNQERWDAPIEDLSGSTSVQTKGNAQFGKNFLTFDYVDGKDMARKLGCEVFGEE